MPRLRFRTVLLIAIIEALIIWGLYFFIWGGPAGRTQRLVNLAHKARQHGWNGTADWLWNLSGEIKEDNNLALKDALWRAEKKQLAGQSKKAAELAWQAVRNYCSPAKKDAAEKHTSKDDASCETALLRALHYALDKKDANAPQSDKWDLDQLEKVASQDKDENVRSLADYMSIGKRLKIAEDHYRKLPANLMHEARLQARKNAADQALRVAERHPQSYWSSKALLLAGTQYLLIGDKVRGGHALRRLVQDFPGTPAAQEAKQKLANMKTAKAI
jgi:hypothetical protein